MDQRFSDIEKEIMAFSDKERVLMAQHILQTLDKGQDKDAEQAWLQEAERRYDVMQTALLDRITIEAGKCGGRPCIRGKRIRVNDILELLGTGASFEEILEDYPFLERGDICAALQYAARQTDHIVLKAT